jgi:hypothetical protein
VEVSYALPSLSIGAMKKELHSNLSSLISHSKMLLLKSFSRTYIHEVLNAHILESLEQVRKKREMELSFNQDRLHAALRKLSSITIDNKQKNLLYE